MINTRVSVRGVERRGSACEWQATLDARVCDGCVGVWCSAVGCGTSAAQRADQEAAGVGATPTSAGGGTSLASRCECAGVGFTALCVTSSRADDAAAAMGGNVGMFTLVELSLSAEGLADTDRLSAPDPMIVVSEKIGVHGTWQEIGRTEVICKLRAVFLSL